MTPCTETGAFNDPDTMEVGRGGMTRGGAARSEGGRLPVAPLVSRALIGARSVAVTRWPERGRLWHGMGVSEQIPPPRSVDEAIAAEQAGRAPRYLYFWGHRPARDGGIGRGCLSQWWPAAFTEDGRTFASAEHYMMAHKAWLFGDERTAERILAADHPREVKQLGRVVHGFDDQVWAANRFDIVVGGSIAKFGQNPELTRFLLGTGDQVLVEASPLDRIWGIGLASDDERAASASTWQGLNLLGFALMAARDALKPGR